MVSGAGEGGTRLESADALRFVKQAGFAWHQRFSLTPDVVTPGVNDIEWLADTTELPTDFSGCTVLDVGTTNGGAAFLAEARGARSVTATDIVGPEYFGFSDLAALLGSRVRFVQSSIYELPEALACETFDFVIFWGVLYHLRHPLLGLDCLRRLSHGEVFIETAVSDHDMPQVRDRPAVRCDYDPSGIGDETNWFVPNLTALRRWVTGAGFEVGAVRTWPDPPQRAHIRAQAGPPPRYLQFGNAFERPLAVRRIEPADSFPRRCS